MLFRSDACLPQSLHFRSLCVQWHKSQCVMTLACAIPNNFLPGCCRTKPLLDDMTTWPMLLRLLRCMDKHASVDQPVSMQVVAAVLAAPFIVDTISAHRAELQNIISGGSTKLSRRTARRLLPGQHSQPGDQAVSAAVVQAAVLCWEQRQQRSATVGTAMQQQHLLMACIIDAALETIRNQLPTGLLPRANISAARRLLTAFYTRLTEQTQVGGLCFAQHCPALCCACQQPRRCEIDAKFSLVQEVIADQAKQHATSMPANSFVSKKGNPRNLSIQNTVNDIFCQAEPDWQKLLL